jgi:hypothetical protein
MRDVYPYNPYSHTYVLKARMAVALEATNPSKHPEILTASASKQPAPGRSAWCHDDGSTRLPHFRFVCASAAGLKPSNHAYPEKSTASSLGGGAVVGIVMGTIMLVGLVGMAVLARKQSKLPTDLNDGLTASLMAEDML